MPRTRDQEAYAARRQEILRAAEALFIERGFHQTGMAAICEAAGMSPGALYRYFPSKAEIIKAFVAEEQAETALLFERLEGARDFRKALTDLLWETMRAVGDQDYARLALEIAAEAARDPEIAAIFDESHAEARDRLAAVILAAQNQGRVGKQSDPRATASLLLMLVDGATGRDVASSGGSAKVMRAALRNVVEGLFGAPGD